jgi:hypothetical protein
MRVAQNSLFGRHEIASGWPFWRCGLDAQSFRDDLRLGVEQMKKPRRGARRQALARFPYAHGADGRADQFSKLLLRQPYLQPHGGQVTIGDLARVRLEALDLFAQRKSAPPRGLLRSYRMPLSSPGSPEVG